MTPTAIVGYTAAGILTAALTILGWRTLTRWAARYLERLLADALDHDWAGDLDQEYRELVEEGA